MTEKAEIEVGAGMRGFWPFYLSEHRHPINIALHVAGSLLALMWLAMALATANGWLVLAAIVNGYAFAWVGHFLFEHNRPATFKYPLRSLASDWVLLAVTLTGQLGRQVRRHLR